MYVEGAFLAGLSGADLAWMSGIVEAALAPRSASPTGRRNPRVRRPLLGEQSARHKGASIALQLGGSAIMVCK
jgi:hypothetical protein